MEKNELIELIEEKLISKCLISKKKIGINDEYYLSIRLSAIKDLGLSFEDTLFVINYLGEKDIFVASMNSSEFDSCNNVFIISNDYIKRPNFNNSSNIEDDIKKYKKTKDRDLLNKMIIDNIPLVYYTYFKAKYYSLGLDKNEMIQSGLIALMNAINNFDFEKGATFGAYAYKCIYTEMLIYTLKANNLRAGDLELFQIIKDLEADDSFYDKEEILDKTIDIAKKNEKLSNRNIEKLRIRLLVEKYSDSLEEVFESDDDFCNDGHVYSVFNEYRSDSFAGYDSYYSEIDDKELREFFENLFGKLKLSEVYVLKEYYGWNNNPRTYKDISKSMNVTSQCIADKHARILKKIKKNYGKQLNKYK